jgi:hypothetical protein
MKISMYLGSSKYWWAYLALKSNPAIASAMAGRPGQAIIFDDPSRLSKASLKAGKQSKHYFYVLWDGATDGTAIDIAMSLLGAGVNLTTLVVGDFPSSLMENYKIQRLYAEGTLHFDVSPLSFDIRTMGVLFAARIKMILMPLKNILQSKSELRISTGLLVGKKRIVFCGSYGTTPAMLALFCERYSVDFQRFDGYKYYCEDLAPSVVTLEKYLRDDGRFLIDLYDRFEINVTFLLAAVHLLGREYFIEKIRSVGLDIFANGYATGINVNVYSTPFYSQHVFLDFSSVVGTGNYPRLADLQYFKKKFVEIGLTNDIDEVVAQARNGSLDAYFNRLWDLTAPRILHAMSAGYSRNG